MSLMAVFNCSFFIILILFLLIIGLIWIHFNTKINNQNINMNQMVRLLTTMTQEVSLLRKKVGLSSNDEIIDISEEEIKDDKITVSDDDSESDSEVESDDESDGDSEDESEDETDDDSNDITPIELLQLKEIKTEKLNKLEEQLEESEIQLNKLEDQLEESEIQLNKLEDQLEEQFNKLEEVKLDQSEEQPAEQPEEQPEEEIEEKQEEYKKMSLNKLKTLVLEKKLISDVSKLKKNDLLTILGIEV